MNFDPRKMFGYPVLRDYFVGEDVKALDYPNASFQPDLQLKVDPKEKAKLWVDYDIAISVKTLRDLVESEEAEFRLNVSCKTTFYSKSFVVGKAGKQELDGGLLRDQIELNVVLVAKNDLSLISDDWNHDFGVKPIAISAYSILAWHSPFFYNIERERFRSLKALIDFAIDPTLEDGETVFDGSENYVSVRVNDRTLGAISAAGGGSDFAKQNVLGSVYHGICCEMIMEMIFMSENDESLQSRRWSSILEEKCSSAHLDWGRRDRISYNAQFLLGRIFKQMANRAFGGGS